MTPNPTTASWLAPAGRAAARSWALTVPSLLAISTLVSVLIFKRLAALGASMAFAMGVGVAWWLFMAVPNLIVGTKIAVGRGLVVGVSKFGLGTRSLNAIVDTWLNVNHADAMGARGNVVARGIERLPLAQAERTLRESVTSVLRADAASGWIRRSVQAAALRAVEKITLAAFRTEQAREGGVDLAKLRDTIGPEIDQRLATGLAAKLNALTVGFVVGEAVVAMCVTYVAERVWLLAVVHGAGLHVH